MFILLLKYIFNTRNSTLNKISWYYIYISIYVYNITASNRTK